MTDNWINTKENKLSLKDKVISLLKIHYKLVLVQADELSRLRNSNKLCDNDYYINNLYEHYIINKLPKTYLC